MCPKPHTLSRVLGNCWYDSTPPPVVVPSVQRVGSTTHLTVADAEGNVAQIHFQRSSGKDSVDAYVAQSIHDGWPHQPSVKTVAEVSYSVAKGFSEPKIISTTPVP